MTVSDTHIEHILLLAENETLVTVDRTALRRVGAGRVRMLSNGREALHVLKNLPPGLPPVSMLVCHERLADTSGLAFLQALRQDPELASLPFVLLTGYRDGDMARKARAFGGCALLARPYTQDDVVTALWEAGNRAGCIRDVSEKPAAVAVPAEIAALTVAVGAYAPAVAENRQTGVGAEDFFRRGLVIMRDERDASKARKALLRAYELDPLHAESCLALSKNSKDMGLEQESQIWLCRAGIACLRRHEPLRAHDIFSKLPRVQGGSNPLVPEAVTLLRAGESRAAAFAFLEAHALEPEQPLHALVSRATLFMDAPEEAMRSLCNALAGAGYNSVARSLRNRLLSSSLLQEDSGNTDFWSRFPVLRDIVSVASFTFNAWKHAA